jgi:hypothetical protein
MNAKVLLLEAGLVLGTGFISSIAVTALLNLWRTAPLPQTGRSHWPWLWVSGLRSHFPAGSKHRERDRALVRAPS